jgi:hypothetical protein
MGNNAQWLGVLLLVLIPVFAPAEEPGRARLIMYPPGDTIYEDLRYVALEAGEQINSFTPPMSDYEIQNIIGAFDTEKMSGPALEAYGRIRQRFYKKAFFQDSFLSLAAGINAKVEVSARTNKTIPWVQPDTDRPLFFSAPVDFFVHKYVQLHFEPAYQLFPVERQNTGYFRTNIPYNFGYTDMSGEPFRAYVAAGGPWWNFQLGRDRLSFGAGHTGNMLISDTPDYYDFARLSFFSERFKYSLLVGNIPLIIEQGNVDPNIVDFTVPPNDELLMRSTNRHIYVHRMDFKILKGLSIGAAEALIIGNSPLAIRYLNPLMMMHNFFSGYDNEGWGTLGMLDNSLFSVDINWMPIPSLSVYGQVLVDEFTASAEKGGSDPTPDSMGFLVGVEYGRAFKNWGALFYGEFIYTDPYLYVDNSPFAAAIWWRRMIANDNDLSYRLRWMGHPSGRDTLQFTAGSRFFLDDIIVLTGKIQYAAHGEHGLIWDWSKGESQAAERTPTGTPEHRIVLSVMGEWKPIGSITLSGGLAGTVLINPNNAPGMALGAETTLGVKYTW